MEGGRKSITSITKGHLTALTVYISVQIFHSYNVKSHVDLWWEFDMLARIALLWEI